MQAKFENDQHYEERIVQALIVDHQWAEQMLEVLDLDYFNLEPQREATRILFDYYESYQAFPSFGLLGSLVKKVPSEILRGKIMTFLMQISKNPLNGDLEYIKETSLDFCKRRSLALALENSLDLIEGKKYEQIIPEVQKALLAGSDRDVGHMFIEHFEKRMETTKRKPVPTPWEEINAVTQGGLSGGELGVIMATSGMGKSHMAVDIGHHAITHGFNVVHYTFELGDIYVGKRYDARTSLINFDDLVSNKQKVADAIQKNVKGSLVIKSFPAKRVTTLALKNHINQLTLRDMRPDLIIVDYGDLMRSTRNYKEKRMEEEAVYEDLRALGQELDLPLWTPTQSNREGLDAEVLTLKHVAECFGKAMISDLFLTMTRKKEDANSNIGNMFIAKSRLGHDGIKFHVLVNTALSKIDILSPEEVKDLDPEQTEYEALKEKFKEQVENGKI